MPISESYRIYKEQLMLPTEEILNPWDWGPGGDGPIFFINRRSPETIYFLEAPKKDPDCEVDWTPLMNAWEAAGISELPRALRQTFAEDAPQTQSILNCYYTPLELLIWKYIVWAHNSDLFPYHNEYYRMNSIARNRIKYLPERTLDVRDDAGHWVIAYALETAFVSANFGKLFGGEYRGLGMLRRGADVNYEEWFKNSKFIVGAVNLPTYTSEFPFEQYIKNNATLWRPHELETELSSEFDYLQPWPFLDIPVQVELAEPVDLSQLQADFPAHFPAQLEELYSQLEAFGADPSILDVQSWRFEVPSSELPPGSYLVTVDGTLELTDHSQPTSEAYLREIVVTLEPMEP